MLNLRSLLAVLALGAGLTVMADSYDTRYSGRLVPGTARENLRDLRPGPRETDRRYFRIPMLAPAQESLRDVEKASGLLLGNSKWNWESADHAEGIYEVPLGGSSPSFAMLKDLSSLPWSMFSPWSAVYSPNGFYLSLVDYKNGRFAGLNHYLFDPDTWEVIKSWYTPDNGIWVNTSAYDPTSGLVYVQMTQANDHYNNFGTFDCSNGTYKEIKRAQGSDVISNLYFLAFTSEGQLYGLALNNAGDDPLKWGYDLMKVDKNSGDCQLVGRVGIDFEKIGANRGVVMSDDDKSMYFIANGSYANNVGTLFKIDLATAETTEVYTTPESEGFKTLFKPVKPADGVPALATDIMAQFTDASLEGKVTFTMPSTTVGGSRLSGLVQYYLTFNGSDTKTGFASPGASVTVKATLGTSGRYTLGVRVKNSEGFGPIATESVFIGADVPAAITNVKASYDRVMGRFNVTWDEPVAADGGYFDPTKLTYDVMFFNREGWRDVKSNVSERQLSYSYTEPSDCFEDCYFRIYPRYNGNDYLPSGSNRVVTGNMVLPWTPDFEANYCGFTFLNANNDIRQFEASTLWGHITLDGTEYNAADDWMFTPPVNMEAGKAYRIDYNLRCRMSDYPETYSIWAGNDSTVAAMTTPVRAETTFVNAERDYVGYGYYAPPSDGRYYFGLHATSQPQLSTLYVDGITIGEPIDASLANEPTDFQLSRSDDGTLKAILTFKAPEAELSGTPLSSIERIAILRDGQEVGSIPASPGQACRFEDTTVPENGTYEYSVLAYTARGAGMMCVAKAFIGVRVPADMTFVTAKYGADNGHFIIEWDSPAIDVAGEPFDESQLKYNLYLLGGEEPQLIAGGISDKRRVYRYCEPDAEQTMAYFGVEPVNNAGVGYGLKSDPIPAGRADTAPFVESFYDKAPHHLYTIDYHPYYYAIWLFAGDADFPDISSVDSDNGFLVFGSEDSGNKASYISGNIDLRGTENPVFSYYYYSWEWANTVEVFVNDGSGWESVDFFAANEAYNDTKTEGWVRRSIDLSKYKGGQVRYKLLGKCEDALYTLMDNFFIGDPRGIDLAVPRITAPTSVGGGQTFRVTASVLNYGTQDSKPFKATLYVDGEPSEVKECKPIPGGQQAKVSFSCKIMLGEEPTHKYYIAIESEGDEDASNNTSREIVVSRTSTVYPAPRELVGSTDNGSVTLQWSAPDLSGKNPVTVTDDLEGYTDFSIGFEHSELDNDFVGDWTMVDRDASYTYTTNGVSYPNIQNKMAYIVMNSSAAGIDTDYNSSWQAVSGAKVFASFLPEAIYNREDDSQTPVAKDDWLVSPLLTGNAQTISFYARTVSKVYTFEKFEVWYSTGETPDVEAMTIVGSASEAPYEWTKFEFELPEGAKYFAVRSISSDGFILFIDDITYQSGAASGMGLNHLGYNVYRDGKLLTGGAPVSELTYTDPAPGYSTPTYQVTAVYDRGESMPARVAMENVGLDASRMDASANVYGSHGVIVVTGASGLPIRVSSSDGRLISSIDRGATVTRISATPGFYVVTVGHQTFKVVVD